MRKNFYLFKTILLLCALVAGSVSGRATDVTTTYDFTNKSWNANISGDAANWTSGKDGNSYTSGQGVQITSGASGANATSPISFTNVKKISVTYCTNAKSGNGSIKVQVGSGTEKSFKVTAPSSDGNILKTIDFDFSPYETGNVKLTVSCTTNSIYIYSIGITTTDAEVVKTDPTITFNNGSVRVNKTLDLGTLFTSNSNGAVSYSITAGSSYASLSGSTLTGVAEGSVTVKAEQAATGSYNVGEATATIAVNPALTLSSIAITTPPTKIIYNEGETFNPTGMVVTATYTDNSTDAVTGYTYSPNVALTTSDDEITVSYTENGVTKTTTQAITVNEVIDYATLPFSYDGGGKSSLPVGFTTNGLGTAYSSSPKMKFENTGNWAILKINEVPGTLTYKIKGNSFSGGTFMVEESADGSTYSKLKEYKDNISSSVLSETLTPASTTRYIRWIYTKKSTGNVALGNISLIAAAAVRYTVTYNANDNSTTGSVPTDVTEYEINDEVTVLGPGTLSKYGYDFAKWNTEADGTGTNYVPDSKFNITANTTLYAQWTAQTFDYTLNVTGADDDALAELSVGGTPVAESAKIAYGSLVSITVATNDGFNYTVRVKDAADNDVTVTDDTFTMPASDVTVTVSTFADPNLYATLTGTDMSNMTNAGTGYGYEKIIVKDGLEWSTKGYQAENLKNMIQLKKGDNTDSYIKLPVFSGKINKVTLTVTNAEASSSEGAVTSAIFAFKSTSTGTAIITNTTSTNEVIIDLTNDNIDVTYSTGYITITGAGARIWNIAVAYEPTDISASVSLAKYATFSDHLGRNFSGTDITVYKAKVEGSVVKMTEVTSGIVPANTGVILYSENAITTNIPYIRNNSTLANNELVATVTRTLVAKTGGAGYNYILQSDGEGGVVFNMATTAGAYMPAGRAYLSTSVNAAPARLSVVFGNEETGISEIENGKLKIEDSVYDLQGRRMESSTFNVRSSMTRKGLYIVNGKKVLVK